MRTVVIIGGTGALGTLITQSVPSHTQLVTVSRNTMLSCTEHYTPLHADVLHTSPETVLDMISRHIPHIDALVYAPFFSYFKPITHMTRTEIEHEFTLIGLFPILYAQAYMAYAPAYATTHTHTFIHIGSGAYRGLPPGRPELGSYSAAKAFAHRGIEALIPDTDHLGIRLVQLNPGSLRDTTIAERTTALFWKEVTDTSTPYYASHLIV